MAVNLGSAAIHENPVLKTRKETGVDISSDEIYENFQQCGKNGKASAASHVWLFLLAFGILCVLLAISIGIIIWMNAEWRKGKANLRDQMEKTRNLENLTEEMTQERNSLNWTLEVIMGFGSFPVYQFCPNKKCQPCSINWVLFQGKCYKIYESFFCQTWEKSAQYCQYYGSELVAIDNLQEQEFISNQTKLYSRRYSTCYDYFLRVYRHTNGFWIQQRDGDQASPAMMTFEGNITDKWNTGLYSNKLICEHKALIMD